MSKSICNNNKSAECGLFPMFLPLENENQYVTSGNTSFHYNEKYKSGFLFRFESSDGERKIVGWIKADNDEWIEEEWTQI